jgi:predicted ATPase/class 3 adenylate cyclase
MSELPVGTVTFVFTDLEGSTRLWEQYPDAMQDALARHDDILGAIVHAHDGHIVKTTGDGLHAVFPSAHEAVDAAVAMQRALVAEQFAGTGALRVRIGVHTCEAHHRNGDYYGSGVNRAARLMSVAHGGQIVLSSATSELLRDASVELVDLGEHRLRDLAQAERIFEVRAEGLPSGFPPLRSLDAFPGNLPVQVSSFVGREAELVRVDKALEEARVVTLTGVGGVGKTRLALQAAADAIGRFPDGVWLCELAPLTDPERSWDALATALRVSPRPGLDLEQSVLEFLAEKRLLLLLDNCEHLLEPVARLVDTIVHRCASVSVLATSREGLALDGERLIAVPSLDVPDVDATEDDLIHSEAVQLFADRARAANDEFALGGATISTAGVLCRRLDGIPLAIELAAARIRSMSVDDLVARLDQRFKLLTRGSRAALERHQTLRNTIDWSYGLLDATERRALNRLSVFAGGWDLRAAEGVVADDADDALDVDDRLGQLVDKSLVVVENDARTGAVRYRLLESIRQYAQERLEVSGETADLRRRHAEYYIAWVEEARPHWRGRDHKEWSDAAVREVDNFRAALDWAVDVGSPDHALRLVAPMTLQGVVGEPALDWSVTASSIPGASDHQLFPDVVAWASWRATRVTDFVQAESLANAGRRAEQALATRRPLVARAFATLAFFQGKLERAQQHALDWLELARSTGDAYEVTHALGMLAGALYVDGADGAVAALEEAARIGDHMAVAVARGNQADLAARLGQWDVALRAASMALAELRQVGDVAMGRVGLYHFAVGLRHLGALEPSAVLLGKADSTGPRFGLDEWMKLLEDGDELLTRSLGEARVAELAARGAALGFGEAVDYALTKAAKVLAVTSAPAS